MAKLEGVKTLDMVGGEITKVEYDGAVYEKTSEKVSEGDLFQLLDGHHVFGGEIGSFYPTETYRDGDIVIPTESIGNATYTQSRGWGAAFRKVSAPASPTIESVDAKVDALAERVEVLEGAKEEDTPTFKEGDRVKTLADGEDGDIKAGEVGTIDCISDSQGKDGDPYYIFVETDDHSDYFRPQDLEFVTEEVKLKVGNTIEVIGDKPVGWGKGDQGLMNVGSRGEVVEIEDGGIYVKFDEKQRGNPSLGCRGRFFLKNGEFKVIDAEVAEEKPRTIKRKARVGERILITDARMTFGDYKNGDILTVIDMYGSLGVFIKENPRAGYIGHREYEVIVEETYKPSEGDIVVITGESHFESRGSNNEVGDIGKVVGRGNIYETSVKVSVPGRIQCANYTHESEMRPATDEEKAQYEQAIKFAKLGISEARKPGEFKKGDIVRIKMYQSGAEVGSIREVNRVFDSSLSYVDESIRSGTFSASKTAVELIAPVESRVDRDAN